MMRNKLIPALMLGSWLMGALLAVAHHLYYAWLDGNIVPSQTQQEWLLRVGTGLAFLVRALLSASVGFAYTQLLWRTLKSKPITIHGVNSLFGIVENAWDFTTWELWTAAPLLAVVAMIAWALPLVAVITPATLTVQVSSQLNETAINAPIPVIEYENTANYAQWTTAGAVGYAAPSSSISRLLLSVASLGSILNIPAPFPNSSYSAEFYGPSISCGRPNNRSFEKVVSEIVANSTCCGNSVPYVGFIPGCSSSCYGDTREEYTLMGLQGALNSSLIGSMPSWDRMGTNTTIAKLYVVVPPDSNAQSSSYVMANKTIECSLYNSSYSVNLTFNNGQQDVTFKSQRLNGVPAANALSCGYDEIHPCKPVIAYISLMDALGKLLLGALSISHYGVMGPTRTQIMSSVLMDARELYALRYVNMPTLGERPTSSTSTIGNISMSEALEQLFANATLSLFSDSSFLQNDTAASKGTMTFFSAQNAYYYAPRNLFIAYGLGILLSAIVVMVGLICIHTTSASYATSFSTILRTTRNPDFDKIVPAAETSGAEPLSKQLANTRVILQRQTQRRDGYEEDARTFFAVDSMVSDEAVTLRRVPSVDSLLQHDEGIQYSTARNDLPGADSISGRKPSQGDEFTHWHR